MPAGPTDPPSAPPADAPHVVTFGHGTASQAEIVDLLTGAEVAAVIDVRRFPGSRRHPHTARDELDRWLPDAKIAYRWEERLGGRRRPVDDSPHTGLRNASFRAYADHLATGPFRDAIADLLDEVATQTAGRTAVMCSESLWWRCHRRLIADYLVLLEDLPVWHLFPDGKLAVHAPTDVVRVAGGLLRYDHTVAGA